MDLAQAHLVLIGWICLLILAWPGFRNRRVLAVVGSFWPCRIRRREEERIDIAARSSTMVVGPDPGPAELPHRRARKAILRAETQALALATDVDLGLLARTTTGLSREELARLCREAAGVAARAGRDETRIADFAEALEVVVLAIAGPLLMDAEERRLAAAHEAGRALVAWLTPAAGPVAQVTIFAGGGTKVETEFSAENLPTGEELLARLDVVLGGVTAQALVAGEGSAQAAAAMAVATRLARRLAAGWGSDRLDGSEPRQDEIDRAARQLLAERLEVVREVLTGAREQLQRLVELLVDEETIDQEALVALLGPPRA